MEHVVFFPASDGSPAFRRLATIDDAARFVEHLRNVENVSEASVHTLTEVPVSFKAWYRVELPQTDAAVAEDSTESPTDTAPTDTAPTDTAPTTIAEVIESYAQTDGTQRVELPEATGSTTGIVVPERDFAASGQFAFAAPAAEAAAGSDSGAPQAQVLEPVFGARRDRGTGYFVR